MTSDPTREALIEGLAQASDWIKPEPGMDGPHGGHIGGVTRQRAVAAIEAALEYLAALSTTPAPLDAAWAAAEAALPEGHVLAELWRFNEDTPWTVFTDNTTGVGRSYWSAEGPSPAAALLALAEKLRESQP